MDTTFREKIEPVAESKPETPTPVTGVVSDPDSVPREPSASTLDEWETLHGKYGLEYLGIKEIGKTFPLSMQFAQVDKYIRGEMAERGIDPTPKAWQDILAEIEGELGKEKDSYKRLRKLSEYLKVIGKIKNLEKLKEKYRL